MSPQTETDNSRINFVDTARFIGILLVYYGHFIESYMKAGSPIAAMHYKFIYSFHMPFFFILSGYIAKKNINGINFGSYAEKHIATRLIPYAFFATILMIPTFWYTDFTVGLELPTLNGYIKGLAATYLAGFPYFNIPVWFLVCLFVVEMMHYATSRFLTSRNRILLFAVSFYLLGSILAWNAGFLRPTQILSQHGKVYPYFMILEAFTCYSLYLVGVYLRRCNFLLEKTSQQKCLIFGLICLLLTYATFDLNKAMFAIPFYDAVVLLGSSHGNVILFPFTAVIGSIMILLISKALPYSRNISFLGRNTLTLFALNGIFYHFINDRLAQQLLIITTESITSILMSGVLITCMSILMIIPFIFLFNRFFPSLVGKSRFTVSSKPGPAS